MTTSRNKKPRRYTQTYACACVGRLLIGRQMNWQVEDGIVHEEISISFKDDDDDEREEGIIDRVMSKAI